MSYLSVWVQFYYKEKDEPEGQPVKVKPVPEDVADLKEVLLPKIGSLELVEIFVYAPGTTPPFSQANAIRPGKKLEQLIDELKNTSPPTSGDHPFIVVAPAPAPHLPGKDGIQQPPLMPESTIVALNDMAKKIQDGIQQPPLMPESTIAALKEMADDYMAKKRTIRLSDATQGAKTDLMDMLRLPEKGASWPNKPSTLQRVNAHPWLKGDEESEENRLAYMAYLRTMLQIPGNYDLADVQPDRMLLSVELFREMAESRKVSGTTDVAIAKSQHVRNRAVRNNIETLLELKTPKNMERKDHSPQAVGEHLAASYLNRYHPVVSVLTDLNARWIFFWYAVGDDDSRMSLHKLDLNGDGAAAEAKYLLDSLYGNSVAHTLPTTFAERQPFEAVLQDVVRRKKARIDLDGHHGHNPHRFETFCIRWY